MSVNIRPYIIINGKNSNEVSGLMISSLPPISKPAMRVEAEEIDGRDGDIVTPLGFSAYDKEIEIGLCGDFDVNEIIEYFNQSGQIIFSNEPDKYYRFAQYNGIDFEKLVRYKTAKVVFHCQPFKFDLVSNDAVFFNPTNVSVVNEGNIYSRPELAVYGSGDLGISVNGSDVLEIDLGATQQAIIIDSDGMNAYGTKTNIKELIVDIEAVQAGSGTPSPDNIRAITGWSECNVVRCGKNLFPYDGIIEYTYAWYSGSKKLDDALYPFFLKGNTTYILHYVNSNADAKPLLRVWKSDGTILNNQENVLNAYMSDNSGNTFKWQSTPQYYMAVNASSANAVILSPTEDIWVEMRTSTPKGTSTNAQIEVGSTATAYEAYTGNTYTIQLGDTYYGGSLDVTTGLLTVTHARIDMGTMRWIRQSTNLFYAQDNTIKGNTACICDIYAYQSASIPPTRNDKTINTTGYFGLHSLSVYDTDYDDKNTFEASLNGKYCVYELATPITVQLTAEEIMTIVGQNNIFADTGAISELIYTKDGVDITTSGDIVSFDVDVADIKDNIFKNRLVIGNYDNLKLKAGTNLIGVSGDVSVLVLSNFSRWL